jgi:Transcriptional regulator PadR-like family
MHGYFDGLGRFAEPWLLVLTSLSDGPKHGYAIMTDVAAFSGVRMEPGTLYGALARLERRGWVRPLAAGRRRSYEIAATWPCRAGQGDAAGHARTQGRPCLAAMVDRPRCIQYNLVSGTDEWGTRACTGSSMTSAGSPTRRCWS